MNSPEQRELLRHTVATLAYRGGKAVRGVTDEVANFAAGGTVRTPLQILTHIGDLLDWALAQAQGAEVWRDTTPTTWTAEVARFHAALQAFDEYLASEAVLAVPIEKLFQGPIADALTHVGQIALLRRLAESPIRGENYFLADVTLGRTGEEQAAPRKEFD